MTESGLFVISDNIELLNINKENMMLKKKYFFAGLLSIPAFMQSAATADEQRMQFSECFDNQSVLLPIQTRSYASLFVNRTFKPELGEKLLGMFKGRSSAHTKYIFQGVVGIIEGDDDHTVTAAQQFLKDRILCSDFDDVEPIDIMEKSESVIRHITNDNPELLRILMNIKCLLVMFYSTDDGITRVKLNKGQNMWFDGNIISPETREELRLTKHLASENASPADRLAALNKFSNEAPVSHKAPVLQVNPDKLQKFLHQEFECIRS